MRGASVTLGVFLVGVVLMVVFFLIWAQHFDFEDSSSGWDAFFFLSFASALVAAGALLGLVVLGVRAFLQGSARGR